MHPHEYIEGLRLFNEGRYWEAHEALEHVWKPLAKGSLERRFYQGLILLSAAFLHRERARTTPARSIKPALRCYTSALEKTEDLPDVFLDLNVADLRASAHACFAPLRADEPPEGWPDAPKLTLGGA